MPVIQEAETWGLQVQSQPGWHSEIQVSLGCRLQAWLKQQMQTKVCISGVSLFHLCLLVYFSFPWLLVYLKPQTALGAGVGELLLLSLWRPSPCCALLGSITTQRGIKICETYFPSESHFICRLQLCLFSLFLSCFLSTQGPCRLQALPWAESVATEC